MPIKVYLKHNFRLAGVVRLQRTDRSRWSAICLHYRLDAGDSAKSVGLQIAVWFALCDVFVRVLLYLRSGHYITDSNGFHTMAHCQC